MFSTPLSATFGCVDTVFAADSPSTVLGVHREGQAAVSPSRQDTGTVRRAAGLRGPNGVRSKASQERGGLRE